MSAPAPPALLLSCTPQKPTVLRATPDVVSHSGIGHPLATPRNIGGDNKCDVADAPNTVRRAAYISRCLRCQQGPVSLGGLKVATEHRSRR